MATKYEETQNFIPEEPARILAIALAATVAFMAVCSVIGITEWWQTGIFAPIAAVTAVFCLFCKIRIVIDEDNITVSMIRPYKVPLAHVIDVKKGDIDITRNYSGWGIKKVKFKNYTAHGIDGAVSVKLSGRIVLTMTSNDPETLYNIIYAYRRQD